MSDPIDARAFREMVRELCSEEPRPIEWDHVEDALFARLDEARSETSRDPLLETAHGSDNADRESDFPVGDGTDPSADEAMFGRAEVAQGDRISEVFLGIPDDSESSEHDPSELYLSEREPSEREAGRRTQRVSLTGSEAMSASGDRVSSPYVAARIATMPEGQVERARATHHVPPIGSLSLLRGSEGRAEAETGSGARTTVATLRRWSAVLGFAAVAASIAFVLGGLVTGGIAPKKSVATGSEAAEITAERWVDPADVPMAPGSSGAHDLGALRSGDMVEATSGAVSFAEADKLSWTISPGSRVLVRTGVDSPRHVLILESGSIRADVLPVAAGGIVDPFVVEAGDTRVAVEGTIFSVTRSSKAIVVDVERGFVVVGPRNELGVGSGRLLHESERGAFSLDGGLTFKALTSARTALLSPPEKVSSNGSPAEPNSVVTMPSEDRPSEDRPSEGRPSEVTTQAQPNAATTGREDSRRKATPVEPAQVGVSSPTPAATAPSDPVMTEASIKASLDRCFTTVEAQKRDGSKDDGVSVTMRSTLRLRVADDGAIKGATFSPPLRSDLQSCAVSLLSAHVDRGARTLEIPVEIRR